jgi:long-chain acyl-CoA synthetase
LPNTPTVKLIIYDGTPKPALLDKLKKLREDLTFFTLDAVRERGKTISISPEEAKARLPKSEDIHCIMYTSGTTGPPKGVILSHGNLIASIAGIRQLLSYHLRFGDNYLAFLPLAHILEYIVEIICLYVGMTIGYGRIKTLTDMSVRNCYGDFKEFRPSVMIGVPAVWETIRKGILGQVNAGGALKKGIFNGSVKIKKAGIPGLSQVVDSVVLSQIKAATGGRLRVALSGGSAMSRETQEFLSLVLMNIVQGKALAI